MTERKKIRVLVAWFSLLTYLLAGLGSAYSLAGLLIIMDSSHRMLLTYEHDEIHLTHHHHRNQDKNDLALGNHDEHDLLTNMRAISTPDQNHPDHEIHLFNYDQRLNAATKNIKVSKTLSILSTARLMPKFVERTAWKDFLHPPPEANPTTLCLRTTILLI